MAGGRIDWDPGVKEEKRGTTTVGKTRRDFFFGFVLEFALKQKNATTGLWHVCLGETPPCLCAGVPPPLLGELKTGFGECRSSVAKLAKSERRGGETRDKVLLFPVNVI